MKSIDERMDMLEAMGYKFRPNPPREGEHGFGIYAHSVMSPEGEPLGSIPLLIGDTACHRLLDKFGCPQKPPENSMPDSSKDSPEEYAQRISDMATGKFRRVPIEFVPALPATKDPIYAQRMPNEAESIEVLRAATGRRDPFPHPAREQSEASSQFMPGQTVWNKHHHEICMNVVAQAGEFLWLHDNGNIEVAHLYHADDFTATKPRANPQNCPLCGAKPITHQWATGWRAIHCGGSPDRKNTECLRGPDMQGLAAAVAAWNSIRIAPKEGGQ